MDNATIRTWCAANGIDIPKNGNVPPHAVIAYMKAHPETETETETTETETPKKEKKAKKAKKEKAIKSPDLSAQIHAKWDEKFSARTVDFVIREKGNGADDVLHVADLFVENGMRSRYRAIERAMNGETPRIKPDKPGTVAKIAAKVSGKAKAESDASDDLSPAKGYAVILPSGAVIHVPTKADAEKVASAVIGAVIGKLA